MGLSSKQVSISGLEWGQQNFLHVGQVKQRSQPQPQHKEPPIKCPRCDSMNTKFCYYNNYNRSQPRYYCKACKRHWTKGGNLRNVPVGGARRNKRVKTTKGDHSNVLIKEDGGQNSFLDSAFMPLPFSLPNISFNNLTSFENVCHPVSSPSMHFNEGIRASEGFDCIGILENVEKPCSSGSATVGMNPLLQLSSSVNFADDSNNWSWDDFNTLISTDIHQPWDGYDIKEDGI